MAPRATRQRSKKQPPKQNKEKKIESPKIEGWIPSGTEIWQEGMSNGIQTLAKFEKESQTFSKTVKLHDSTAFSVHPLTFTSGPLKGQHMLLLSPVATPFRFLDLPAEIRNMVYHELLVQDKIEVESKLHSGKSLVASHVAVAVRGDRERSFHIMSVCKQICDEAAAVAYGANELIFRWNSGLKYLRLFLDQIGEMRKHVRHISLGHVDYYSSAMGVFLQHLEKMSLTSISFDYSTFCTNASRWGPHDPQLCVDNFLQICRRIFTTRVEKKLPIRELCYVRFTSNLVDGKCGSDPSSWPKPPLTPSEIAKHREEVEASARRRILEYLETHPPTPKKRRSLKQKSLMSFVVHTDEESGNDSEEEWAP